MRTTPTDALPAVEEPADPEPRWNRRRLLAVLAAGGPTLVVAGTGVKAGPDLTDL